MRLPAAAAVPTPQFQSLRSADLSHPSADVCATEAPPPGPLRRTQPAHARQVQKGRQLLEVQEEMMVRAGGKDPSFSTYATWWIRDGIGSALVNRGRTIRLPSTRVDQLQRLRKCQHGRRHRADRAAYPGGVVSHPGDAKPPCPAGGEQRPRSASSPKGSAITSRPEGPRGKRHRGALAPA